MEIHIAERAIGEQTLPYIIAEAGSNHNGDFNQARQLIDIAAGAGADAVKFQIFKADELYSKFMPEFTSMKGQNVYELIQKLETPREWIPRLARYCTKKKIHFLATPFDFGAVDALKKYVSAFKIASFEIGDMELLSYAADTQKPMIISTGMASLGEIEDALRAVRSTGNDQIILLHCNSLYPTPTELVNLNAMKTLKDAFKIPVGFSDHTLGIHISVAAAALGACVIEKHITISKKLEGPDHSFALEPPELNARVSSVREVSLALGDGIKERSAAEDEAYVKGRRSIHAKTDIPKNIRITRDMLIVKRPGYGIAPKCMDIVEGRKAQCTIRADQWITWDMI